MFENYLITSSGNFKKKSKAFLYACTPESVLDANLTENSVLYFANTFSTHSYYLY
jgi:hypothetical protein